MKNQIARSEMTRRIKAAAAIISLIAFTVFILAPFIINETAYAARESAKRDWDELTSDGQLKDSATSTDSAVLMDALTGEVLYQENANEKKYPASITKIMTCLLVIENSDLDDVVTVPDVTIDESDATKIGIVLGEEITVRELLYGLMLVSGNDAAIALAAHVSGSVSAFAQLMNQKAAELGMTGTHFANPHGLHDDNHYTTAMDMARLAYAAMKNPVFREIVGTKKHTPSPTNIHNEETLWDLDIWENSNNLISDDYEEPYAFDNENEGHAIGIKTGYTSKAKYTLVSAAQNEDGTQEVISVVLSSETKTARFYDSITMFKYAFDFYDTIELTRLLTEGLKIKTHVDNAINGGELYNLEMNVVPGGEVYMTDTMEKIALIKEHPETFTRVENYNAGLTAPIAQGQEVGTVDFYLGDGQDPVLTCALVAAKDVEAMPTPTSAPTASPTPAIAPPTPAPNVIEIVKDNIIYIAAGAGVLILIIILIAVSSAKKKARSRRHAASTRGRRNDTRFRDGVQRGRGRRR